MQTYFESTCLTFSPAAATSRENEEIARTSPRHRLARVIENVLLPIGEDLEYVMHARSQFHLAVGRFPSALKRLTGRNALPFLPGRGFTSQ
jgi:hypothetical protein